MSYSTKRAHDLADVLERFATLNAYQLVGHRANLDAWIAEAAHTLAFLDAYGARFGEMKRAQLEWVKAHEVQISPYCPHCGGACEFGPVKPPAPTRVPTVELDEARKALREGARRFLRRLFRARMLEREEAIEAADRLGTGFEPDELARE